ncbi:CHAD domain-containing protein [Paeniglutamicibacter sp.]|uniref:CHAD domain-containing protein n=1 Tax=Paeniglutamicibacter sp. TaxID=1934391 RepID=UPI003988B4B4
MADAKGPVDPPRPGREPGTQVARKNGPVLGVAIDYLDGQITELLTQDPEVRTGSPEAVHEMRSATRRLRSALEIYRSLFDARATKRLGDELKWLTRILGRPRDADVMRERLRAHLRELPEELKTGLVAGPIEHVLGREYNSGYIQVRESLETERYRRLLADLQNFRDHPPATDRARRPALAEGVRFVNNEARRLEGAHRAAARTLPGHARDVALHEVRKGTKRLLHAAESVAGIYPKRAKGLARRAHRLQRILGSHQDSVMTRAFLDSLAAGQDLPEESRRAYERIRETEEAIARSAAKKYAKSRKKDPPLRLRR